MEVNLCATCRHHDIVKGCEYAEGICDKNYDHYEMKASTRREALLLEILSLKYYLAAQGARAYDTTKLKWSRDLDDIIVRLFARIEKGAWPACLPKRCLICKGKRNCLKEDIKV